MFEQDLNPTAAKFISSLVKSLQILCNGQVDFNESIELIGHINVRVDRIHKYDYIVDEHVSKEGGDSSTTFLSNSYHSFPPTKQLPPSSLQAEFQPNQQQNIRQNPITRGTHTVKVSHKVPTDSKQDNVLVKMEGNDNDCMVLPASPEDFEPVEDIGSQGGPIPGTSSQQSESFEMGYDIHHDRIANNQGKKRKADDQNSMACMEIAPSDVVTSNMPSLKECNSNNGESDPNLNNTINKGSERIGKSIDLTKFPKETVAIPQSMALLKENITNIATMLNLQVIPQECPDMLNFSSSVAIDVKTIKKQFQENMDKQKIQQLRKLLKLKNGKRKKQELRALIAECGLSEDLIRSVVPDPSFMRRKFKLKDDLYKTHKKFLRHRTQERQQKLLEMAENLKRSKGYANTVVISKVGSKKISLHKSSVSIFSYQTQFLNSENIDSAAEAFSGRLNKYGRHCDKNKDKKSIPTQKCQHLKRKMKQLVSRITKDINEAGYRVIFSNTIGSDVEFHSAELSVIPMKVDELFPEVKDDSKMEISEEDYAKHLEREHFIEKQKANEGRMKELEAQLTQILSGVEEVLVAKRKRYGPGSSKPTDAERMKLYRKKLKEDLNKYQEYKQKRALTSKKRRLGTIAVKMKNTSSVAMSNSNVNEERHNTPNLSLPETVTSVNMHCPQVYVHPSTHQPPTPTVNLLNTGQYVGQVPGLQAGHQHQQSLPYTGEMDIVELIAATHNVQNQHFA